MSWHPGVPQMWRNTVVSGDCRELMKQLPDDCVDIVFTSPPYNCGIKYGVWNDRMQEGDFWDLQASWIADAFRITRTHGRMYVIVRDEMLWRLRELAEMAGWTYHQLLVWCKPNMAAGARIMRGDWTYLTEFCLLFHKGNSTRMLGGPRDVNTHNWIVATTPQSQFNGFNRRVYPAQMSLKVAQAWLSRTPGEIVFDPFCGSGTSLIAAKRLGKEFIGFDIDPAAMELAKARLRNTPEPLFRTEDLEQRVLL